MSPRRSGIVTKLVDSRTAAVTIERLVTHPKYGKQYRQSKAYLVDVPATMTLELGSTVEIQETRPISRSKHWRVVTDGGTR